MKSRSDKRYLKLVFGLWRSVSIVLSVLAALLLSGPLVGTATQFLNAKIGVAVEIIAPSFEGNLIRLGLKMYNWWFFDIDRIALRIDLVDSRGVIVSGSREAKIPGLSQAIIIVEIPITADQAARLSNPFVVEAKTQLNYALGLFMLDVVVRGRFI